MHNTYLGHVRPEDTLDFHVRFAWAGIARLYGQLAASRGTTMAMGQALLNIERGGTPSTQLGPRMGMEKTSLSRLLNNLEDQGMIERRADDADRRIVRIHLTEDGKKNATAPDTPSERSMDGWPTSSAVTAWPAFSKTCSNSTSSLSAIPPRTPFRMGCGREPRFQRRLTMASPTLPHSLNRVAVLGSGVMGSAIACHLAQTGYEVLLLDLPAKEGPRNATVDGHLKACIKSKPSPLYRKAFADRITTGNFEDDMAQIAGCDWIIEVIVERLDIKRILFEQVEQHRKPGTPITSNTSGIPIGDLAEGRSDDFQACLCGTHFFNPPRYLALLEIIPHAGSARSWSTSSWPTAATASARPPSSARTPRRSLRTAWACLPSRRCSTP